MTVTLSTLCDDYKVLYKSQIQIQLLKIIVRCAQRLLIMQSRLEVLMLAIQFNTVKHVIIKSIKKLNQQQYFYIVLFVFKALNMIFSSLPL